MADGTMEFSTAINGKGFQKDLNGLGDIIKGSMIGATLSNVFTAALGAVSDSIGDAVSRFDTLNRFPKIMDQMGYGAARAERAITKMSSGIDGLPTTLDGIVGSGQRMTITLGDLDKGTDSALALNNAFLASGSSGELAARGTEQYIQSLSRGKMEVQEWKVLTETMPYALQQVATSFGFAGGSATAEFGAALRTNQITMTEFNDKLIELSGGVGGFAELAKTATGGIGTAWTNLKTGIVRETANIMTAIDAGLSETKFKSIENVIGSMKDGIVNALSAVGTAFAWAARNAEKLLPVLKAVGAVMGAIQVGKLAQGMLALGAATAATAKAATASAAAQVAHTAAVAADTAASTKATRAEVKRAAAEVAATSATLADAGAITLKGVVVGFLTGKIKLAAAAQLIWNAVIKANPLMWWAAAISIVVAGIVLLIKAVTEETEEQKNHRIAVEESIAAHKALTESLKENAKAYNDQMNSIADSSSTLTDILSNLKSLQNEQGNYSDNIAEAKTYVAQFNKVAGETVLSLNEQTGALNMTTGAIDDYIAATIKQREWDANMEAAVKAAEDLAEAKRVLADAEKVWGTETAAALTKLRKGMADAQEAGVKSVGAFNRYSKAIQKANAKMQAHRSAVYAAQSAYDALTAAMAESTVAMGEVDSATLRQAEHSKEVADAQTAIVEKREEEEARLTERMTEEANARGMLLEEYKTYLKDVQKAIEEHEKAVDGVFNDIANNIKELPTSMDYSYKEMMKILEKNVATYKNWTRLMAQASSVLTTDALAYAKTFGTGWTTILQDMIDDTSGTKAKEFNEAVAQMIGTATQTVNRDMSEGLQGALTSSMYDITRAARTDVQNSDLASVGEQAADEIKSGITDTDYTAVGDSVKNGIIGALSSGTLFTELRSTFESMGYQSISLGLTSAAKGANSDFESALRPILTTAGNMVSRLESIFRDGNYIIQPIIKEPIKE